MGYLVMKHSILILFTLFLFLTSCNKENETPISGEVTIDSKIYQSDTYYTYGFNFVLAKKVSTLDDPEPDLTIEYNVLPGESEKTAYFTANTYEASFSLYDNYNTPSEALSAFEALMSFGTMTWTDFGTPLAVNQIWIIRTGVTGSKRYAKILITSVSVDTSVTPVSASCTFRWVYQPDGSQTFTK
jgi:hypothetical protein